MLQTFLRIYPHDLVDGGMEEVLDRLHGEVGATGVSVWAGSPAVVQWRAQPIDPRILRTSGGLYFRPDDQHYSATRIKPIVANDMRGWDSIELAVKACWDRGIAIRLVISASMIGHLPESYPDVATKNVYGDRSHVAICLANPDVQNLLKGMLTDLSTRYELSGVVMTDFAIAWPDAGSSRFRAATEIGALEAELLSACFCESCHQGGEAAGVEVTAARRSVEKILQGKIDRDGMSERRMETALSHHTPLAEYFAWRANELSSLWAKTTESCPCGLLLDCGHDPSASRQHERIDWSLPAGVMAQIDSVDDWTSVMREGVVRSEARIPACLAGGTHGPELVGALAAAVEHGVSAVEIDDYALLSDAALDTIKQAFRFARRESVV
jgi:hypothetical protein